MGHIAWYLLLELGAAVVASFTLPKRACRLLAGVALLLGIVAPLAVWGYAGLFISGDTSAYGMLGTGLAVLFAPGGIALVILSVVKRG